jgi:hypothetical protein
MRNFYACPDCCRTHRGLGTIVLDDYLGRGNNFRLEKKLLDLGP